MIKEHYKKELLIAATQKLKGPGNNKKDTAKIQSWLTLYSITHPGAGTATNIDGDFGPATDRAVKNYQKVIGVAQSGIVNQQLFDSLCEPVRTAFGKPLTATTLRALIIQACKQHLSNSPFELDYDNNSNMGPWVRSYMNMNEGTPWFWCMGFVQAIVDQAASTLGKDFRKLMPMTFSCDTVGTHGLNKGFLTRYNQIRNNPAIVKPGDLFLLQKTPQDWTHTGIIINIDDDTFETIEGNTNNGGSSNGNSVCKRIRNFRSSKLDVFSVESLT